MDTIALFFADLRAPSEQQPRSSASGSLPDDVDIDEDDTHDDVEAEDRAAAAVSVTQWTTTRAPFGGHVAAASLETIARLCVAATRPEIAPCSRDTLPAPVRAWLASGDSDEVPRSDRPELEAVILAKLEELAADEADADEHGSDLVHTHLR